MFHESTLLASQMYVLLIFLIRECCTEYFGFGLPIVGKCNLRISVTFISVTSLSFSYESAVLSTSDLDFQLWVSVI
jgi:hypothetical protein